LPGGRGWTLNPLDAADPDQAAWLQALVWPEQAQRLAGLRGALKVAEVQKPLIRTGSLTSDALESLCDEAPRDATLVVFHTAVLAYVTDQADRRAFAHRVASRADAWICNEAPIVMPDMSGDAGVPSHPGQFLLSVNGAPVAWTDPHGASIKWIAGRRSAAGYAKSRRE
jgi:hypothetical protein